MTNEHKLIHALGKAILMLDRTGIKLCLLEELDAKLDELDCKCTSSEAALMAMTYWQTEAKVCPWQFQ